MGKTNMIYRKNKAHVSNMKIPGGKISGTTPNPAETFITEDERRRGGRNRCKSGHIWPTNWNINLGILIYSVVKQIYVVLSARGVGAIFPIRSPFVPICRDECNKAQMRGCDGLLLQIITMVEVARLASKSRFFFFRRRHLFAFGFWSSQRLGQSEWRKWSD